MSCRVRLIWGTVALSITGLVMATIPFISYLGLSASAGSSLPHLNIKSIKPGHYAYFDNGRRDYLRGKYLVIRETNGKLYLLLLLTQDDEFSIPDSHWWTTSGFCNTLAPATHNGKVVTGGRICCVDPGLPTSVKQEWQWTYNGKHTGKWVADLFSPPFTLEGNEIVIGKTRGCF